MVRRSPVWLAHVGIGFFFLFLFFLMPNGENGCVTAGYLCSLSILSVYLRFVLLKYIMRGLSLIKGGGFHLCFTGVAHHFLVSLFVLSFSLLHFYPSNPFIMASHQPHPVLFNHYMSNFLCFHMHCVLSWYSCCCCLPQHLNISDGDY